MGRSKEKQNVQERNGVGSGRRQRRSRPETRRAVRSKGKSAVDLTLSAVRRSGLPLQPWHKQLIGELLSSGAPVKPENLSRVLPIIASHGVQIAAASAEQRERELAARRSSGAHNWRAHDDLVGLALDMGELREAKREEEEKQRRVAELERRLGELGVGTESSGSESEDDDESKGREGRRRWRRRGM
jgi:hypothetical protein